MITTVEAVCKMNVIRSKMLAAFLERAQQMGRLEAMTVQSSGTSADPTGGLGYALFAENTRVALAGARLPYPPLFKRTEIDATGTVLYIPVSQEIQAELGVLTEQHWKSLPEIVRGPEIPDPARSRDFIGYRTMIARNIDKILRYIETYAKTHHS